MIEQEVEKYPAAQRLMTHPGVGALTALAFVLIIGEVERVGCGKQITTLALPEISVLTHAIASAAPAA